MKTHSIPDDKFEDYCVNCGDYCYRQYRGYYPKDFRVVVSGATHHEYCLS